MRYRFDFASLAPYWADFVRGTLTTLDMTVLATIVGLAAGVLCAIALRSRTRWLARLTGAYVEAIRNTPFLIQIFFLFFGPADLAASLGHLGDSRHPDVEAAMARVLAAGKHAGVAVGIFASDTASARQYREAGYRMITLSADVTWLLRATRQALQEARS